MANLTLAPEDDDSHSPLDRKLGPSPRRVADDSTLSTEMQRLRGQFDPKKVGFGILAPWPGTEQAIRAKESAAIGTFFDGRDRKEQE